MAARYVKKELLVVMITILITFIVFILLTGCSRAGGDAIEQTEDADDAAVEEDDGDESTSIVESLPPHLEKAPQSHILDKLEPFLGEGAKFSPDAVDTAGVVSADIDLSELEGDELYAAVYMLLFDLNDNLGKTVKVTAPLYHKMDDSSGRAYLGLLVTDEDGDCIQGIEVERANGMEWPSEYPPNGSTFTVTGTLGKYVEDGFDYPVLERAIIEDEKER